MADLMRLPVKFYDDHQERDLDTPVAVRRTKRHVYVDPADPALPELVGDARYYADPVGFDPHIQRTVCRSAQALLRAVQDQGGG